MKNFKFARDLVVSLRLLPSDSVENKGFNYRYFSFMFMFGLVSILMAIPVLKLKTLPEIASKCYDVTVMVTLFFSYTAIWMRSANFHKFCDKFNELMLKRSERPDLKATYEEMNRIVEKYNKIMRIYTIINFYGPMLLQFLHVLFIHFTRGLLTDDYLQVIPIWLPFDYKTSFLAYSFAFALELVPCWFLQISCRFFLFYVLESFLVLSQLAEDIKREIVTLKENWKSDQNKKKLMEKLREIVWFNAGINECIKEFVASYELVFLINLIWSIISICISFLTLDIELAKETIDMGAVGAAIGTATLSLGAVFIFCECGERISNQLDEVNDAICELEWNTFPLKAQQMMPMIILTTQHPLNLASYGDIACARETFKKVVSRAYSYFNVFRG